MNLDHVRVERDRYREAYRWLTWLDGDRTDDGTREMEGTAYQAAQRIAGRLHEAERASLTELPKRSDIDP